MTTKALPGNRFAESLETYADPTKSLDATATMALAYEQRTANLLAVLNGPALIQGVDYTALGALITERLGLA